MKIAEYNEMMAYLMRPAQKETQVASLMDEYLGDQKEYQRAVDEGFQGTYEEYLRMKSLERTNLAIGGGVIEGEDLGSREGFANAKFDDPSADIKVGDDLGQGISQDYKKADGTIMYRSTTGKTKEGGNIEKRFTSFKDAQEYRSQNFDPNSKIKPVSELPKDQQKFINKWLDDYPGVKWEDLTNNERGMLKKGQDVRSGTGSKTKKGAENPQFQPLDNEGKKIAKKVYGTTDISDSKRQAINAGEVTMDTKPVKFEKGKDISLKMKRGSGVVTGVEFPKETIDADGKIETAKDMEKRFINFLKNRVQFSKKGLTGTGYANADLAAEFPISEKQGGRLARYYINKLGLKYKEGPRDPGKATITEKTEEKLKVTSGIKEERKITQLKTKILKEKNLARKVDKAHRVSKSHMEKLGLTFDTDLIGMDSRIINQVIVKPSEIKLNNLYARQRKVLDLLKENPDSVELKNRMTEINKGVRQIVKDTSGRLIGVTIDLDTLEPTFEGIKKKNTFTKFLGDNYKIADLNQFSDADLSKAIARAVDAEAKRGFVPNDFKNILTNKDSRKAILEFAKKRAPDAIAGLKKAFANPTSKSSLKLLSQFPTVILPGLIGYGSYKYGEDILKGSGMVDRKFEQTASIGDPPLIEEGFTTTEKLLAGTTAGGAAYAARKPILKTLGKIARIASYPSIAAGFGLGQFVDVNPFKFASDEELEAGKNFITRDEKFGSLKEDPSFALAGADLLYPEIAKQTVGKFAKPTGKGILSMLGRAAINPFGRLARGFTPLGIGLQGIELINQARKEQRRIDAMSPEEKEDFIAEQESLLDFSA
jgi:hypothetical protein